MRKAEKKRRKKEELRLKSVSALRKESIAVAEEMLTQQEGCGLLSATQDRSGGAPVHWVPHKQVRAADINKRGIHHLKANTPKLDDMPSFVNAGNLFVNHVTVGYTCPVQDLATWIEHATEHVIVCSLIEKAKKKHTELRKFMQLATSMSLHRSLGKKSGNEELVEATATSIDMLSDVRDDEERDFKKTVADAIRKKFVYQVFGDTFIILHLHYICYLKWCEWDFGPSPHRIGTLRFKFQKDKQRFSCYHLGIVSLASHTPKTDDIWVHLAKWIKFDHLTLVCGKFGQCNEDGVAKTAVAARETVGHRLCTVFDYSSAAYAEKDILHCYGEGGFLCFADHYRVREDVSDFPPIIQSWVRT